MPGDRTLLLPYDIFVFQADQIK